MGTCPRLRCRYLYSKTPDMKICFAPDPKNVPRLAKILFVPDFLAGYATAGGSTDIIARLIFIKPKTCHVNNSAYLHTWQCVLAPPTMAALDEPCPVYRPHLFTSVCASNDRIFEILRSTLSYHFFTSIIYANNVMLQ